MNAVFYYNESNPKTVTKTLTTRFTSLITLKEKCSVLEPVISLNVSNINANYCYIATLGRYYFITGISSVKNNLWEVTLRVDVLMSYKSQFLPLDAIIKRQQNKYNLYLDDPNFKTYNYQKISTIDFPDGFSNTSDILLVVAGG